MLNDRRRRILIAATAPWVASLVVSCWVSPSFGEVLQGKVIGITDGDTLKLLDGNKRTYTVRLAGIDAPEKTQPFGSKSKENLSRKVFGKAVEIDFQKKDIYRRIVAKVLLSGDDICLQQVREGMAWHFKRYERDQSQADRKAYATAEIIAKQEKIGLWQEPNPVPPWVFRSNKRNK